MLSSQGSLGIFFYVYIFNLEEKTYKLYEIEVVIILRYALHVSELLTVHNECIHLQ